MRPIRPPSFHPIYFTFHGQCLSCSPPAACKRTTHYTSDCYRCSIVPSNAAAMGVRVLTTRDSPKTPTKISEVPLESFIGVGLSPSEEKSSSIKWKQWKIVSSHMGQWQMVDNISLLFADGRRWFFSRLNWRFHIFHITLSGKIALCHRFRGLLLVPRSPIQLVPL